MAGRPRITFERENPGRLGRKCYLCYGAIPTSARKDKTFCSEKCWKRWQYLIVEKPYLAKMLRGEGLEAAEIEDYISYQPNSWQRKVRESQARFKVIAAGRRAGKSFFVTNDSVCGLVTDIVAGDRNVWIVAPTFEHTMRIWREVWFTVNKYFLHEVAKIHNSPGRYRIELRKGGYIEAKSANNPEDLVGVGLHKIIVDEAPMVDQKAWTMALRPTLIDFKGSAIFIGSPKSKNWFYDLYCKGQRDHYTYDPEWESWQFTSFDNDKLKHPEELKAIVKEQSKQEYAQEIMAQFIEGQGQLFRNIREHTMGGMNAPMEGFSYHMGIDLGGRNDRTVVAILNDQTLHFDHIEIMDDYDWPVQKERIKDLYDQWYSPITTIDATALGGTNAVQDFEDDGMVVESFKFSRNSKPELIGKLIRTWENNSFTIPTDQAVMDEFEFFTFTIQPSGARQYSAPKGRHDDIVIAIALAIWPVELNLEVQKSELIRLQQESFS